LKRFSPRYSRGIQPSSQQSHSRKTTAWCAWTAGGNDRKLKGNDYLQQFALPNFFFFVTTAYNILRHRGIPIGKRDFLGPVNWL
jgi:hypothetical protein